MTTPEKRRISSLENARLCRHDGAIKKNLDLSSGELMDSLVDAGFDLDDKDEIMKVTHRRDQINLLLKRLRFREDGFRIFVVALKKSGSGYLAELLESDLNDLSKSTQTSPTLYRRSNGDHPNETPELLSTNSNIVQTSDVADGPKLNTVATSKDSMTQKDTLQTTTSQTTFYLPSPEGSEKSNKGERSNSTSVLRLPEVDSEDINQKSRNESLGPIYENAMGEYCRDVGTSVESEYDDEYTDAISLGQSYEQLQLENVTKEPSTYEDYIHDKILPLKNPARLHGFSGINLTSSLPEEFSTLFEEKGWYAGISEQNISVAIEQARSQHGSYIIWYSQKYKTIVITVIDKDSRKGRVHFKMLRTHDEISTLYYFDERVHCRTPVEILNAVKKKGLLICAKNVSNYYQ